MRARNIKPGFFNNDHLLQCEPLARLLFEGLWCLADREGRLEDRPTKIKIEVLPVDNCDVDDLLRQLADKKDDDGSPALIYRYQVVDKRYIQVVNFSKHQNPHLRETKSVIQAPQGYTKAPPRYNQGTAKDSPFEAKPDMAGGGSPADSLIPDSLIPEFKKAARVENHRPVDNSEPEPEPDIDPEPEAEQKTEPLQEDDTQQPFFTNLKTVLKKLEPIYPSAFEQRQIMLFVEANIRTKNHEAIIHSLNALIEAHKKGNPVKNLKRYLDAVIAVESQNYNAAEHEKASEEFKKPPTPEGMMVIGSIMAAAQKKTQAVRNRGQT